MATIANRIQELAKLWGGTPRKSTIEDAIEDLVDNAPFGTKTEMVEIVPEQSVIGTLETDTNYDETKSFYTSDIDGTTIVQNKVYEVHFNGKNYKCEAVDFDEVIVLGNFNIMNETGMPSNNEPFCIMSAPTGDGSYAQIVLWNEDVGETITLAIYEEQEVVKQLDAKFIPEPVVFTLSTDMTKVTCNKTYADCFGMFDNNILNAVMQTDALGTLNKVPVTNYCLGVFMDGSNSMNVLIYNVSLMGNSAEVKYYENGNIEFTVNMPQ